MNKAEKFISEHTRNCSNYGYTDSSLCPILIPWLTPDQAKEAVEIAREEMLEYVKYQLDLRLPEILDYNGVKVERKDFINDLIQAMKDK